MVSIVAGNPVNYEGGRADLLGPGHRQLRCCGDRWSTLWTQEAQGGLPRRKQQVQVWKVSRTHARSHIFTAQGTDENHQAAVQMSGRISVTLEVVLLTPALFPYFNHLG